MKKSDYKDTKNKIVEQVNGALTYYLFDGNYVFLYGYSLTSTRAKRKLEKKETERLTIAFRPICTFKGWDKINSEGVTSF